VADAATTGPSRNIRHKPAGSSIPRSRGESPLACAIERRYAATHGRSPHRKQLAGMVAIASWAKRCSHIDGLDVKRSTPQIIRAIAPELGWPVAGRGTKEIQRRYATQVKRWLDYLAGIGVVVDGREAVLAASGEGEGILVHLRADVAQLARAPLS
jgi:hypothetical protein